MFFYDQSSSCKFCQQHCTEVGRIVDNSMLQGRNVTTVFSHGLQSISKGIANVLKQFAHIQYILNKESQNTHIVQQRVWVHPLFWSMYLGEMSGVIAHSSSPPPSLERVELIATQSAKPLLMSHSHYTQDTHTHTTAQTALERREAHTGVHQAHVKCPIKSKKLSFSSAAFVA